MARPPTPSYDAFAARAKALTRAIPEPFLDGVEDVVVHREAHRHPLLPDVLTLGECEPSSLAALSGSGLVRSIVHLYYGSFVELARDDEGFDLDGELRETIEHEIQHHIEDRAGVRTLIDEDDLFDAHQRFLAGLETPPGWYRQGERLEPDVYAVECDLFVELRLRPGELARRRGTTLRMKILGEPFEAVIPKDASLGETLTFEGEGLLADGAEERAEPETGAASPEAGDLHLVLAGR